MEKYLIAKGGVFPVFVSSLIRVGEYDSYQDAYNSAEAWALLNAYKCVDNLFEFGEEWLAMYKDSLVMEVIKGSEAKKSDLEKISINPAEERKEFMEFFEKVLE